MKHLRSTKGDGNGNPAGLFLSWQALSAIIAVTPLLVGAAAFVRKSDLRDVDNKIMFVSSALGERSREIEKLQAKVDAIQAQQALVLSTQEKILEEIRRHSR